MNEPRKSEREKVSTVESSNIIIEKDGRTAIITLDRPNAINSLNLAMLLDLELALHDIESDDEIDVLILTAAGKKGFCAGMDLKEFEQGKIDLALTKRVMDKIEDLSKPTIGAITDGYCVTGGLELALCCDFLVASDQAKFGDTHARVNVSGGGATVRMPRLVGLMKAKYMIFTSQFYDAYQAKELGLVIEVFPSDDLQEEARGIANEIQKQNQTILRKMKQIMNRGWRTDLYAAWCLEEAECLRSMSEILSGGFKMADAVSQTKKDIGTEKVKSQIGRSNLRPS